MYTVYIHKLYGHIVYIGSGSRYRYKAKTKCRSKNHLDLWNDLTFEIVAQNLSKEDSLALEEKLINEHWDTCLLLNTNRKVHRVIELDLELLRKNFSYSESSPSGLIWNRDVFGGRNHSILMISSGSPAGSLTNRGYWSVELGGRGYSAHRIVYALLNNLAIPKNLAIDHIDRNPSNNKISNLRLVTHSDNNRNRNFGNKDNQGIMFDDTNSKTGYFRWRVIWSENGKRESKSFGLSKHLKFNDFETAKELTFKESVEFKNNLLTTLSVQTKQNSIHH